jgi:hypothetical protein
LVQLFNKSYIYKMNVKINFDYMEHLNNIPCPYIGRLTVHTLG